MAEFGVGLHPEFGLVEAHLLGFLVDPQADRVLQDQPDGRAGDHHEDADRDDADDLRPQPAAEDADRQDSPDAGNQVGRDGSDYDGDPQRVEQRYRDDVQGAAHAHAAQDPPNALPGG